MKYFPSTNHQVWAVLEQIESQTNCSIAHLTSIAKLDPSKDFVNADMKGVSFYDQDISGFNFSGSDLRGTQLRYCRKMKGVKYSEETELDYEDELWLRHNYTLKNLEFEALDASPSEYVRLGREAFDANLYLQAEYWLLMAIRHAEEINEPRIRYDALYLLMNLYIETRRILEAEKCLDIITTNYSKSKQYQTDIQDIYHSIGRLYKIQNKLEEAVVYFSKGVEIARRNDREFTLSISAKSLSDCKRIMKCYDEAEHWLQLAINTSKKAKFVKLETQCYYDLGIIKFELNHLASAEADLRRAWRMATAQSDAELLIPVCEVLADISFRRENSFAAKRWLQLSLDNAQKLSDEHQMERLTVKLTGVVKHFENHRKF